MYRTILTFALFFMVTTFIYAQVLNAYGPGGPAPAMKEAAAEYEKKTGIKVNITAGPAKEWIEKALKDADIIFSGSEHMMTDFINQMKGEIISEDVMPLYLRPSAILVRKGNPENIKGFKDLLEKDIQILVVNGAGQTGLWEDIAGRDGDIEKVRNIRKKIVHYASNSGEAKDVWIKNKGIDAWIIWNIWQKANMDMADLVETEPEYTIYRDCAVVLTGKGKQGKAEDFIKFLQSGDGKEIFSKWGWKND